MSDKSRRSKSTSSTGSNSAGPPRNTSVQSNNSNVPCTFKDESQGQVKKALKELYQLTMEVQEERSKSDHNITQITKTQDKIVSEQKVTPHLKNKLKQLYGLAALDASSESDSIRRALKAIHELKDLKNQRTGAGPKQVLRRGALMQLLQQSAVTLPLWIGKPSEAPPPLCGAVPAGSDYIAKARDKVAARVKSSDGEENWILAEVVSWVTAANKYEVDDIDAEEGKERHVLSRRRVIPLPLMKANPETDPNALFEKGTLIMALYPQTTCFYKALVHEPPKKPQDEYSVLFEDTSYAEGYSPPLTVPQRYVILFKEGNRKK